jgi:hypothetical protein
MLSPMTTTRQTKPYRRQILSIVTALLILGSSAAVSAVDIDGTITAGEYGNQLSFAAGDFLLYWELDRGTAHFGIQARTEGWVSLGIDPTQAMAEADMIFGWVEAGGSAGALDCYSTGLFGPHPPDEELGGRQDILSFAGSEQGGITTLEFTRPLDATDAYDKALPQDGEVKIIWASGDSDNYLDPHNRRGSATISLAGGQSAQAEGTAQPDLYGWLYRIHGALMSTAFVLLFTGMFFPRYFKRRKWWLKTHRRIGITGGVIGVVGVGMAVYMIAQTTQMHLRVLHSYIGGITIILMIFTPFLGHFMLKIRKVPSRAKQARAVHRWIGRVTLLFMAATIVLGLFQAGIL